jgi:hypothetical protein
MRQKIKKIQFFLFFGLKRAIGYVGFVEIAITKNG